MGDIRMTDAAATTVKERFNDLAAEFDNTKAEIKVHAADMMTAAGEFSGSMTAGAAAFDMSWQDCFEFCSTSAALIAGNTNAMKVDLAALDQDTRTTITL